VGTWGYEQPTSRKMFVTTPRLTHPGFRPHRTPHAPPFLSQPFGRLETSTTIRQRERQLSLVAEHLSTVPRVSGPIPAWGVFFNVTLFTLPTQTVRHPQRQLSLVAEYLATERRVAGSIPTSGVFFRRHIFHSSDAKPFATHKGNLV
jgi:hypothetical protein